MPTVCKGNNNELKGKIFMFTRGCWIIELSILFVILLYIYVHISLKRRI